MSNNIRLIYTPMKQLKTNVIGIYVKKPLTRGTVTKNAILPYILKQACGMCPSLDEISKHLENLYGADMDVGVMKKGECQILHFEAETIEDKYAPNNEKLTAGLLKLMLDIVFNPAAENGGFIKSVVDVEKNNAKNRIQSVINNKAAYADKRCREEMCKGEAHALPTYGFEEDIDALDEKSLYAYYKEFIRDIDCDIYVSGDADADELNGIIAEATKDIDFAEPPITEQIIHTAPNEPKRITEHMDVTQGKLVMGFATDTAYTDNEYFALMVTNSIFGGGAHSKLFNNVREKLSLAYYASSMLIKAKGIMLVNAGIEFDNFDKAYNEILAQLENMKNGDITDAEYDASVKSLLNSLKSIQDDASRMQMLMYDNKCAGAEYGIDYIMSGIGKVTIADVVKTAKKIRLDTVYFLAGKEAE